MLRLVSNIVEYCSDSIWEATKPFVPFLPKQKTQEEIKAEIDKILAPLRQANKEHEAKKHAAMQSIEDRFYDTSNDNFVNCVKKSGYITSLNEKAGTGVINNTHEFSKYHAANCWNKTGDEKLATGTKVSFIVFEGLVTNVEIIETFWGDQKVEQELCVDKDLACYQTSTRTIVGNVVKSENWVYTVEISQNNQQIIVAKDFPEGPKFELFVGDVLSLDCTIQDDPEAWNGTNSLHGNILKVLNYRPTRMEHGRGMVTAILKREQCCIINDQIVASDVVVKEQGNIPDGLEFCENYEFDAIENWTMVNSKNYEWRLTTIRRTTTDAHPEVKLFGEQFHLPESTDMFKKFLKVQNNSGKPLKIVSCDLTSISGKIVTLSDETRNVHIKPHGFWRIYLDIKPTRSGSFMESLTIDFGDFTKKTYVNVEVSRNRRTDAGQLTRQPGELVPGQRFRRGPRFVEKRFEPHLVSSELRQYDFKKNIQLILADLQESHFCFLFDPLDRANYQRKMEHTLFIEEIEMEIHFERYQIDRAYFESAQNGMFKLEVLDVAEKRPSICFGDTIIAKNVCDPGSYNYEGCIQKIDQHHIYVRFGSSFKPELSRRDYQIDFAFSRSGFRKQHHALKIVTSDHGLGFDFLFPPNEIIPKNPQLDVELDDGQNMVMSNGKQLKWINENLNIYQKQAVVNVLRGENRPTPYIIYGPPGTGKTHTVIELISQISTNITSSRIIVAAPSNSAAFLIVERLLATGKFKAGDFVRFVSYNQIERDLIPQHLKKYCATIDISEDEAAGSKRTTIGDGGLREGCTKSTILQYKILISTLGTIGQLMHIKFPPDHFTHIIIDEAGQSVETETLIPMSLLPKNRGQVILAGDPKQLGPIVLSRVNKKDEVGYGMSMLERLSLHPLYSDTRGENGFGYDPRCVTKLKKNYRSIPSVLKGYNQLFYDGELEAEITENDATPEMQILQKVRTAMNVTENSDTTAGIFFCNVGAGRNERQPGHTSWFNESEAASVFKLVCKLQRAGISLRDIGIITPYALQVKKLRELLDETFPLSGLKIGSVEEFQGQERQVIVISTVRTNKEHLANDATFGYGFINCKKRMNVAISRAKSAVIIYGREAVLSRDESWRSLIAITKDSNTYSSEKIWPRQ